MKVILSERRIFWLILLGLMTGLGFYCERFLRSRTVPDLQKSNITGINSITIGIDPGHGGIDSGTKTETVFEKYPDH